jgi:SAM-dependent methyltransferase
MAVASHLGINLDEYDARIRSFVPDYEQMIAVVADTLTLLVSRAPHIIDLGTGTGALAAACLLRLPDARLTIVDEDAGILAVARDRLAGHGDRVTATVASFADAVLPSCDAIIGSLAFHHVRTPESKLALYRRIAGAVVDGGVFLSADCHPSGDEQLARRHHEQWRAHLRQVYSPEETDAYLRAWAEEDAYMPLPRELALLADAGLSPDVVWRHGGFAVIAGWRR